MRADEIVYEWGWTWLVVPHNPLPDGYRLAS